MKCNKIVLTLISKAKNDWMSYIFYHLQSCKFEMGLVSCFKVFWCVSLIRYIWLFAPFFSMSELTLDVKVKNTNYNTSVASANASSTHPGQGPPRFLEYAVCYPCLPLHNI